MNILSISHEYPPIGGGGATACKYLSRELARLGHNVTVVTAAYQNLPQREQIDDVKILRLTCKRTKVDKSSLFEMFTFLFSAYRYIDRLVKEENFDCAIVYFGIPSGPIGLHLKHRYHIPYIVRFGGGDIPGAQKRFAYVYKLLSPFIRSIWKNASALIANSDVLRERAYVYEDRYTIDIIPNGVDSDYFTAKKVEAKTSIHTILFVSRIIEGKGLQYVIPHMSRVYEETGMKLTIVGDGPYRHTLEELATSSDTSKYVIFAGRKTGDELKNYYNNADVFILPSLSEGMPNVVLEAMSMGLPIVMTPCGGSKELIEGNGIVADINVFVDQLIFLCKDKERLARCGELSAIRAREFFSWNEKAKAYEKILQGAIDSE